MCMREQRQTETKRIWGQESKKRDMLFFADFAMGAAEEREIKCREEEKRGDNWQEMPVPERDAARVGEGGGLWYCSSSCEGGFV